VMNKKSAQTTIHSLTEEETAEQLNHVEPTQNHMCGSAQLNEQRAQQNNNTLDFNQQNRQINYVMPQQPLLEQIQQQIAQLQVQVQQLSYGQNKQQCDQVYQHQHNNYQLQQCQQHENLDHVADEEQNQSAVDFMTNDGLYNHDNDGYYQFQ
jgi:hypothetical protein